MHDEITEEMFLCIFQYEVDFQTTNISFVCLVWKAIRPIQSFQNIGHSYICNQQPIQNRIAAQFCILIFSTS